MFYLCQKGPTDSISQDDEMAISNGMTFDFSSLFRVEAEGRPLYLRQERLI